MKKEQKLASGIAIGLLFGTIVGTLTNNIGLWLGVGIAIGAGVGNSLVLSDSKKKTGRLNSKEQVNVHPKSTSI